MTTKAKASPRTSASERPAFADGRKAAGTPIDVGILPNLLGYNIRRARIALWRDFSRTVGEGEIRPSMFSLLMLVEGNPGISQSELANQLDQDKATLVGIIHWLQKFDWVVRKKSATDKRRQGIYLTPGGRRQLAKLRQQMLDHEARFTRLFTAEELSLLIAFLRRIHS
jgi:DNA-binding MarR family transcriptional regulator